MEATASATDTQCSAQVYLQYSFLVVSGGGGGEGAGKDV